MGQPAVHYRSIPEWGTHIAQNLGGVDKVIDLDGAGTSEQSMSALRVNGEVAFIGVLSPDGGPNPVALMMAGGSLRGIYVGSAAMPSRLNAAADATGCPHHPIRSHPQIGTESPFSRLV